MTYLVKQKIRGRTYAYEAENYWDPEKKQSRQKRRYLGVWDEATGHIIPKTAERDVKTTKSLGPAYLLDSVSSEIQLRKKLSESFGEDGDIILAMAMSKLLHQTSLKNLNTVLDDSFLPEMYSLKESFSSQWLSNFLERLATKEKSMNSFYNSLIAGEDETLIFDITSLSSASQISIGWSGDTIAMVLTCPKLTSAGSLIASASAPLFQTVSGHHQRCCDSEKPCS